MRGSMWSGWCVILQISSCFSFAPYIFVVVFLLLHCFDPFWVTWICCKFLRKTKIHIFFLTPTPEASLTMCIIVYSWLLLLLLSFTLILNEVPCFASRYLWASVFRWVTEEKKRKRFAVAKAIEHNCRYILMCF